MDKIKNNYDKLDDKINYLENNLNTNIFNNPIKKNNEELRKDLLDLANTLVEEIKDYTNNVILINILISIFIF